MTTDGIETLLSVPPAAVDVPLDAAGDGGEGGVFATSDPPGRQLGSGGGTAHLLHEAWRASGGGGSFGDWLRQSRKLIVHGSGQSRRLPAYAAEGKLRLPLPLLPTVTGQRPDQTLLDFQRTDYGRLFRHAPATSRVMVTCGDVLVRSPTWIPVYPEADVVIVGLSASPEEASNHGVLVSEPGGGLAFFLQKPPAARIAELSREYTCALDTGIWLLSERAVMVLMALCGWDPGQGRFADGRAGRYELFDRFGLALGSRPTEPLAEVSALSCAALPLPEGRFYHFGTNRSVFASLAQLSHPAESRRSFGHGSADGSGQPVVLNATVRAKLPRSTQPVWIENSDIPADWTLHGAHMLTGVPANTWRLTLPRGACLDLLGARTGEAGLAVRVYGFDDPFRGALEAPATLWLGRPVEAWLRQRGIGWAEALLDPRADIQDAALFPVVRGDEPWLGTLIQWMLDERPAADPALRQRWIDTPRVSATDLVRDGDARRRALQRRRRIGRRLAGMTAAQWLSHSALLDLEWCARASAADGTSAAAAVPPAATEPSLAAVHLAMLRARAGACADGSEAFALLRELMVRDAALSPVRPARNVLEDQIVWGRAPARLDLAGGWSDTPPYCLEHGGQVVNLSVNLNGQPPVQVFARLCETPHLVLQSIDLGQRETITTYDELLQPSALGGFSIARAALRLAGFDPRFHAEGTHASLREQLRQEFGGGIELNMLAAIPKGSGLGTSSILAGTLLGVLGELCGLGWSQYDVYARTTVLEQMLTSGGGWQDQIGGLSQGLKLIETQPGLRQTPEIRWLPEAMLREAAASGRALLYYTGITRLARNILAEIVAGIFLNDRRRIALIEDIAANAHYAANVVQRRDWPGLQEVLRRSWRLNQALDAGTNPPQVQAIVERIARWSPALKLLGAGGGGYMLILADDQGAAAGIRDALRANPPNARARFVDVEISETGLQITRS